MWRVRAEKIGGCGMTEQEAFEALKDFDKQVYADCNGKGGITPRYTADGGLYVTHK